ncbi:MAG: class I tRNA ligase family protein [Pelagibacterales bacterium]|nr:class I tRNA ligase family protein [Pelagibacterales bacterium]
MCCTFGDETDIRWWKKHDLPLRIIIGKDGKIEEFYKVEVEDLDSDESPIIGSPFVDETKAGEISHISFAIYPKNFLSGKTSDFHKSVKEIVFGRTIKQAKESIIEALKDKNFLLKQETITRAVKCAERSGVPIEILVVPQWFIKVLDKKELLKAKAAECNWYPDYMKVRIDQWIDGLQWDWCISRQRFFGVKFPVWYSKRAGEQGKILVAEVDQLPCDPAIDLPKGYARDEVTAETDIMDTWATSSISPQLSSKGISAEISFDKARHEKLFPADLRPQAHEIIRTWAFYTIVKAALHQNSIPWKNLMISGWCLAADKTKMSKSKGNVVTPTALIEEKGSDIVRYWASTSHLGADTAYSEEVFKIGQKLVTKLFNAAKFASMNFDLLTNCHLEPNPCHPERSEGSQNSNCHPERSEGSQNSNCHPERSEGSQEKFSEFASQDSSPSAQNDKNVGPSAQNDKNVGPSAQNDKNVGPSAQNDKNVGPSAQNDKNVGPSAQNDKNVGPSAQNDKNVGPSAQNNKNVGPSAQNDKITESSDLWILARLQQVVAKATSEFEQFEYARAREAIEQFFWHDFCDNYLEICKVRSYGLAAEKLAGVELSDVRKEEVLRGQCSAILTLNECLKILLKLFAPFIPHVCDEIYSTIFAEEFAVNKSINARGNWPKVEHKFFDENLINEGNSLLEVIFEVRKFKSEKNISMKTTVEKVKVTGFSEVVKFSQDLANVCNAKEVEFLSGEKLVEVVL